MLNTQKKRFAEERLAGANQTEAARRAGYSEKTAYSKGNQLAKDKDVLEYMAKLRGEPAEPEPEPQPAANPEPGIEPDEPPKVVNNKVSDDPVEVMRQIMKDNVFLDPKLALEAAKALAPYTNQKLSEPGKKDQKNAAAKKAASKFRGMAPPKLVVNN